MPLNRLLQIVTAALAAMGTMLLGMGQREVGMTLIMFMAAGLSVWLTDVKGWLYLNRNVANLIMLGAALFSLRDIFHIYSEIQALTFAQFLIYLQIILLFQKKDSRTYWLLIMLSLLQVVVAALFSQGVFFGFLLVGYMLLASLALTLLMLSWQGEPIPHSFDLFSFGKNANKPGELLAATSNSLASRGKAREGSRWPLIDRSPEIAGVSIANQRQGISGELFRRIFGMSARTLGLTMVLFIVVPRFGQVGWRGGFTQPKATVGFNDQVTLGEMGKIIESPSEVMRVRFFYGDTEKTYPTDGLIYLYGGLLMDYQEGRWKKGNAAYYNPLGSDDLKMKPGKSGAKLPKSYVSMRCDLEGLDHAEIFFVAPYVAVESNSSITVDEKLGRLVRERIVHKQKFPYRLGTTAFLGPAQSPLTPKSFLERLPPASAFPQKNGEPTLKKLKQLADKWIAESNLPPEDALGRARFLENKLAFSGLYKYSLLGQKRDTSMDPIEDFLIVHKAGHCEYFATALALMLRHVGIPARMVVGFKCDEWHEAEQCYQVRQLHAHTWVQAYLKPEQLPKELLHGEDYWEWDRYGGWMQLDPTPARNHEAENSFFTPVAKAMQWLDFTWSYYVVELNYERQRKAIFAPIAEAATKMFNYLRNPQTWRNIFERIYNALHTPGVVGGVAWVLLIVVAVASLALLSLSSIFVWLLGRKLRRIFDARRTQRRLGPRIEVEFYRRLEHLLAKNGLSRPLGQTPREFASIAGEWLALRTGEHRLMPLPAQVVDAYYHVRFGCLPLDSRRSQEVEHILKDLEGQMADGRFRGKNGKSG